LLAFLLRHGRSYPTSKHWTQRHRCWLAGQTFQEEAHDIVFLDYREAVWTAQERRDALIERISAMVASWSLGPLAEALRGLRGIDLISAATFIASTGDFSRFESPHLLMGYLGLVPSEHSSGGTIRRGGITKTGNREARRMLIEAAWSYQYPACVAKARSRRLSPLLGHISSKSAPVAMCPCPAPATGTSQTSFGSSTTNEPRLRDREWKHGVWNDLGNPDADNHPNWPVTVTA
jgi:transposase